MLQMLRTGHCQMFLVHLLCKNGVDMEKGSFSDKGKISESTVVAFDVHLDSETAIASTIEGND